ncbi:MAG: MFS transporter [Bacteroidota bacterium]|nr:MFS transporter [Bacteroidota bacterium]
MAVTKSKTVLLLLLIFSQFAGTSLWFAGNAIIDSLPNAANNNYANLTSVVQLGFITGTLVFSLFAIADRFSSTTVFFISAIIASVANLGIIWMAGNVFQLSLLRFFTGFFLAGIYPVGMKIAADSFPEKVGKALGFLVGALVLGTALPHLVRSQTNGVNWKVVIVITSALAAFGGLMIFLFMPSKKPLQNTRPVKLTAAFHAFRSRAFRLVAYGYFGHMWELYAFWAALPVLFIHYNSVNHTGINIYLWSFAVIASGSLGCAFGGMLSQQWGSKKVAFYSLLLSGICCLVAPFVFQLSSFLFLSIFLIWGFGVTADSPQFSALVAKYAEAKNKGTALTIVTSIGFSITIISIQLFKLLFQQFGVNSLWLLLLGPVFGVISLKRST